MIRDAFYTDVERIMNIWLTASVDAHDFITKEYWTDKYADVKENYIPKAKTYVYVEDKEILGFVSVVDDKYMGALFVDVKHQRKGVGKKLTAFVKNKYKKLCLKVYQKNEKAVRFYEKMGFKIVKTSVDESTGEEEHLMCC